MGGGSCLEGTSKILGAASSYRNRHSYQLQPALPLQSFPLCNFLCLHLWQLLAQLAVSEKPYTCFFFGGGRGGGVSWATGLHSLTRNKKVGKDDLQQP